MTLSPLLAAALPVQFHVACALVALALGPIALLRRRRDRWHRIVGMVWILAMGGAAVSSFLIVEIRMIGPFSPIHALSVLVLWSLWSALVAIRSGNVAKHRATLRALYVFGLLVPGLFTLLPGRIMHEVVFGATVPLGFAMVAVTALVAVLGWRWAKRKHHLFPSSQPRANPLGDAHQSSAVVAELVDAQR
jgi:uncharacterized membrane protein